MNLYQWDFNHQPHYIVADDFAEAERIIKLQYSKTATIKRIDNLGPYVLLPEPEEPFRFPPPIGDAEEPAPVECSHDCPVRTRAYHSADGLKHGTGCPNAAAECSMDPQCSFPETLCTTEYHAPGCPNAKEPPTRSTCHHLCTQPKGIAFDGWHHPDCKPGGGDS